MLVISFVPSYFSSPVRVSASANLGELALFVCCRVFLGTRVEIVTIVNKKQRALTKVRRWELTAQCPASGLIVVLLLSCLHCALPC